MGKKTIFAVSAGLFLLVMLSGCISLRIAGNVDDPRADFDIDEKVEVDWQSIKDLSQIGPGLLVEVVEENEKVLIWLK